MKVFFLFTIFAFLLLMIQLARSLNVTCEAGGPYGTGSTILVVGNVSGEVSNITSVTIDITKYGSPRASQTTSSDATGTYFAIFTQSFDIGTYDVNVTANNSTHIATCTDTFEVIPPEISKECQGRTISVEGNLGYVTGNLVNSGKIFISIEGLKTSNTTTFSNGYFKTYLTTCLSLGRKYMLQLSVIDEEGKKGTIFIPFIPT